VEELPLPEERDHTRARWAFLIYAFSEHGVALAEEDRFPDLVRNDSTGAALLFESFFLTSLICLGLARCPSQFVAAI
jgi:hypothetical protein